jgi:hypothetical protein
MREKEDGEIANELLKIFNSIPDDYFIGRRLNTPQKDSLGKLEELSKNKGA